MTSGSIVFNIGTYEEKYIATLTLVPEASTSGTVKNYVLFLSVIEFYTWNATKFLGLIPILEENSLNCIS